ncbi:hypothetical protein COO91_07990 [Nostoc flagelliforme CCNUN1]|uniref:Uncharacterized protein n=1 Tax=Nostoc flagelliforme CCNUN1 TaxID=2038116 RepID=A0A2K8T2M4_9NOSO|nr:hypothetical protein COO91_07990 [Nostoc flagelliforme CCNUN1]
MKTASRFDVDETLMQAIAKKLVLYVGKASKSCKKELDTGSKYDY